MHSIRLTGHWTRSETASGQFQFSRRFGRPRLPAGNETVWLTGVATGDGTLSVNGEVVATLTVCALFEAEVTALLKPRNVACLKLGGDEDPGEIVLEIRD